MKRRPSSTVIACGVTLAVSLGARAAHADVSQILAVTPRAMSMGGAYSAVSDDPSALYYNPAGLVRVGGSYIGLAFVLSFPNLGATSVTGQPVPLGEPRDEAYGLHLAWSPRLLEGNLGIGFSILLPHRRALRFTVHRFEDPYFVLYENSIELTEIRVGAAYKFFDLFSVGASMLLLAGLDGKVQLEAPFQSRDPEPDPNKRTVLALNAVLPNRQFFTAGVQFYPTKKLTFGVSYREPTFVPIGLPIDFTIQILGLTPIRTVANLDVKVKYSPPQITFGGAYRALPSLLVSLDLVYALYSKYEVPYGGVSLDQRFSPDIVLLPPRVPDTKLKDVLVPRLGVEWVALEEVTLRAGYYYFASFIQSSDAPILDSDKHSITFGASYDLGSLFLPVGITLHLTGAGQMVLFTSRNTAGFDHSGQIFSTTFGAEFTY